eukprot:m51a1_g14346 putative protein kinase domain containing protein (931) ;mRNA; f:170321-173811
MPPNPPQPVRRARRPSARSPSVLLSVLAPLLAAALLLLGCAGPAGAQCGGWPPPESYDDDMFFYQPANALSADLSCSGVHAGSVLEVVQLFTPEAVPSLYSSVCVNIKWTGIVDHMKTADDPKHAVTLAMYDDVRGVPAQVPRLSANFTGVALPLDSISGWLNFDTPLFVAAAPRVFIGFRIVAPCATFTYASSYAKWPTPRLSFRRDAAGQWQRHRADWAHDNVSALAIRASLSAHASPALVPSAWHCAPSRYNDTLCDCECGAWDPACAASRSGPLSPSCAGAGEVCDRRGRCVAPGWNESVCPLRSYGSYDACDCGCGGALLDPDCRDSTVAGGPWLPAARPCAGLKVARCSDAGACVEAWPGDDCPASAYNDTLFCNCGCAGGGVLDPDCLGAQRLPSDCGSSACFENACRAFPVAWHCPITFYSTAKQCHCGCGAWDPDCEQQSGNVVAGGCTSTLPTCNYSGCGNKFPELLTEDCDGGQGCGETCRCLNGWQSYEPPRASCFPACGDAQVVGDEQCDSGQYCTGECACPAGFVPYSPARASCKGCPNGILDADMGEQCDGGSGCVPGRCVCAEGFASTAPPSVHCVQRFPDCGDARLQAGEECDSGLYCNASTCTCAPGHRPIGQLSCAGCGNGVADDGEQCDGGAGCSPACRCARGFAPSSPPAAGCVDARACGNGLADAGEECDGGKFCLGDNCTCAPGHAPLLPRQPFCAGCGNGRVEAGEECDSGAGCSAACACTDGFRRPAGAAAPDCEELRPNATGRALGAREANLAVAIPVGVTGAVVAGAMCALVGVVALLRRREAPGVPIERPAEHRDDGSSFVATDSDITAVSGLADAPVALPDDATPILIVPVAAGALSSSSASSVAALPPLAPVETGYYSGGAADSLLVVSLAQHTQSPQMYAAGTDIPLGPIGSSDTPSPR